MTSMTAPAPSEVRKAVDLMCIFCQVVDHAEACSNSSSCAAETVEFPQIQFIDGFFDILTDLILSFRLNPPKKIYELFKVIPKESEWIQHCRTT